MAKVATVPKIAADRVTEAVKGANVLIVGGTAGIGRALAISLLKHEANVTVVGRRQPDAALARAIAGHGYRVVATTAAWRAKGGGTRCGHPRRPLPEAAGTGYRAAG